MENSFAKVAPQFPAYEAIKDLIMGQGTFLQEISLDLNDSFRGKGTDMGKADGLSPTT